jgi:hypothetical protein
MPEIKHIFNQGKMNKDLDERLIPNGQYIDANNIQVSTSDTDDVGTVQSLLGNSAIPVASPTTISDSGTVQYLLLVLLQFLTLVFVLVLLLMNQIILLIG